MLITSRITALLLAGTVALAACSAKPPKQLPPDPVISVTIEPKIESAIMQGPAPGSQSDFAATLMGQDAILFDTDRFNIDSADVAALQTQAQWLLKYPGKRATLEGHCDERGTRDYNLALGDKRANSAKNYLVSLGVDAARLTTVTYGKERPAALDSTEEAWARNRRAVTITID